MKIAYFDLHKNEIHEDYSVSPSRYGGGATFARHAKQVLNSDNNEFKIFAMKESFSSYTEKDIRNCHKLSEHEMLSINNFNPVAEIFKELQDFDIFMFHHDGFTINKHKSKAKNIYWPLTSNSSCHPNNDLLLLYSPDLLCYFLQQHTKVDLFKIGVDVNKHFQQYDKEPYIFQCTQHVDTFGSIEVAKECIKNNYKAYFAGPIFNNYNLLEYIDDKNTFYLGQISQQEKINLYKKATFSTFFHKHETPFNLSLIEGFNYGVIPICSKNIFFNKIIKNNYNGFFYENNFKEIVKHDNLASMQLNCFNIAKIFSKEEMVKSFVLAVNRNLYIQ